MAFYKIDCCPKRKTGRVFRSPLLRNLCPALELVNKHLEGEEEKEKEEEESCSFHAASGRDASTSLPLRTHNGFHNRNIITTATNQCASIGCFPSSFIYSLSALPSPTLSSLPNPMVPTSRVALDVFYTVSFNA